MPEPIRSYWDSIEPFLEHINIYDGPIEFAASIADLPRPVPLLYAAHMCLSEVSNGGFLQLFLNSTGVLVPEAEECFNTIGMPIMASLLGKAAAPLGYPYPRDRADRWNALFVGSGSSTEDLERILEKPEKNRYRAIKEATSTLPFDELSKLFWSNASTENGGFEEAANRYAQNTYQSAG